MTYLNFLLIFIGLPMIPLVYLAKINSHPDKNYIFKGILVLCGLAFFYTTPWDNYILSQKVWWYGPDRVIGTIGYVPIEEYTFFLVQTVFSGLWTLFILNYKNIFKSISGKNLSGPLYTELHSFAIDKSQTSNQSESKSKTYFKYSYLKNGQILKQKIFVLTALLILFSYGVYALTQDQSFYMGLILAWALPIVILQFAIGGQHLLVNKRIFLLCCLPPTLYLWCADYYAISDQIWMISDKYTLGYNLGVLPIEEMTFFLITNVMVTQGLLLFLIMKDTVYDFKMIFTKNPKLKK